MAGQHTYCPGTDGPPAAGDHELRIGRERRLVENGSDFLQKFKTAADAIQRDSSTVVDAHEVWGRLGEDVHSSIKTTAYRKFEKALDVVMERCWKHIPKSPVLALARTVTHIRPRDFE